MNKGVTLGILGVIACAMAIVLFQGLNKDTVEEQKKHPATVGSLTETTGDKEQQAPVLAAGGEAPHRESIPSQTTQRLDTPSTPVTQPVEGTPSVKGRIAGKTDQDKAEQAKTTQLKPETSTTTVPPAQQAEKPKTTPAQPVQSDQKKTADSGSPSLKPLEPKPDQTAAASSTAEKQPGKVQATSDVHTLSKIGLHFRDNDIYLRIEADSAFKEKVFTLPGPDRLVVDLAGKWKGVTVPSIPGNQLVTKARVGQQPDATRIVLDLSRNAKVSVNKVSDSVLEVLLQ